jgi:hypothetical protein
VGDVEGLIIAVTFFGASIGGFSLLIALSGHLQIRRLQDAHRVSCAAARTSTGTVRIEGVAEPPAGPGVPRRAPLSGREYAWCEAHVSYDDDVRDADGDRRSRTVTVARQPGEAFVVRDATGVVLVRSAEIEWNELSYSVNTTSRQLPEGLRRAQVERGSDLLDKVGLSDRWADVGAQILFSGDGRTYDLVERLVTPGTPVIVVGDLQPGPDGTAVLGGRVFASTRSEQGTTDDVRANVRTYLLVGAIGIGAAVAAQIARVLT